MFNSTMNRLFNVGNKFQGEYKKVLCVCSAGLLRSPTTAWILSMEPYKFNTRACGTAKEYALIPLDEVLIEWADEIIFVDKENYGYALDRFSEELEDKRIIVLNIPDIYPYRTPELCDIIVKQYEDSKIMEGASKEK